MNRHELELGMPERDEEERRSDGVGEPAGGGDAPEEREGPGEGDAPEEPGEPARAGEAPEEPGSAAEEDTESDLESAWVAAGERLAEEGTAEDGGAEAAPPEKDVDPELLELPRKRRRRHPLISLVVIGLSIYLMVFVWSDFRYFFESDLPTDLGEIADLMKKAPPQPNKFVTLRGAPDRKHSLLLEGRVSGYDSFFRLRRGGNRYFVQRHRARRSTDRTLSALHRGRLVRFGSLPYREAVRTFFGKNMTVAHDLDLAAVRRGKRDKTSGTVELVDRSGLKVRLDGEKVIWINAAFPNEWLIQFSKSAYESRAKARERLSSLELPYAPEEERSPSFWRFVVHAGEDQAKQLMKLFRDPSLHAGVIRRQLSYSARWRQIRVAGSGLLIDAKDPTFPARYELRRSGETTELVPVRSHPVRIPAKALLFITASSKFSIPDDALVVLAGEEPSSKWLYLLLYLLLGAFVAFNSLVIVSRLRGR